MWVKQPIVVTAAAVVVSFLLLVAVQAPALTVDFWSLYLLFPFASGFFYTQFFEYWCHKVPMHRGLAFFSAVRINHLSHHRVFHGDHFQSRDPETLKHIAGRWFAFPSLFALHAAVLQILVPAEVSVPFLAGAALHYLIFEVSHWFTHVADNRLDRFLSRVPWLAELRAYQIEHHRLHHETPDVGFNFNPPYLGDMVFGRMPSAATNPEPARHVPAVAPALKPAEPRPTIALSDTLSWWRRPAVKYGSAVAVGLVVIGVAAIAYGRLPKAPSLEGLPGSEATLT